MRSEGVKGVRSGGVKGMRNGGVKCVGSELGVKGVRSEGIKGMHAQSGTLNNKISAALNVWCTYEALTQ